MIKFKELFSDSSDKSLNSNSRKWHCEVHTRKGDYVTMNSYVCMYLFFTSKCEGRCKKTRSVITCDVKNMNIIASTINTIHNHKYVPPYNKKNI